MCRMTEYRKRIRTATTFDLAFNCNNENVVDSSFDDQNRNQPEFYSSIIDSDENIFVQSLISDNSTTESTGFTLDNSKMNEDISEHASLEVDDDLKTLNSDDNDGSIDEQSEVDEDFEE